MSEIIDSLLDNAQVWQASRHQRHTALAAESSGYSTLDDRLPGGGWPRGAMIECLMADPGIGELQLILPVLRRMTQRGLTAFWIDPPHIPYAPALTRAGIDITQLVQVRTQNQADQLWTLENCLRSTTTGLVMLWLDALRRSDIRRIQLAAEAGDSLCILFRGLRHADQSSPAALRLKLATDSSGHLRADILKRRGGWPVSGLTVPVPLVVDQPDPTRTHVIQGPWLQ